MKRLLTDHKTITATRLEDVSPDTCGAGQARLKIESFALTANNVTYAASGFAIGYWHFFPTGIEGQGLVPVWGTAHVTESNSEDLAVGTRLYGFFPLAEELMITVQADGHGGFVDAAKHRAELPAVYNLCSLRPICSMIGSWTTTALVRIRSSLAVPRPKLDWVCENTSQRRQGVPTASLASHPSETAALSRDWALVIKC